MAMGNRTNLAPILMSEMVSYETTQRAAGEVVADTDWTPVTGAEASISNAGNYFLSISVPMESDGSDSMMLAGIGKVTFVGGVLVPDIEAEFHTNNLQRNTPSAKYMTSVHGFHWMSLANGDIVGAWARSLNAGTSLTVAGTATLSLMQLG